MYMADNHCTFTKRDTNHSESPPAQEMRDEVKLAQQQIMRKLGGL